MREALGGASNTNFNKFGFGCSRILLGLYHKLLSLLLSRWTRQVFAHGMQASLANRLVK